MYDAQHMLDADSGCGRRSQDALNHLHSSAVLVNAVKLRELLPNWLWVAPCHHSTGIGQDCRIAAKWLVQSSLNPSSPTSQIAIDASLFAYDHASSDKSFLKYPTIISSTIYSKATLWQVSTQFCAKILPKCVIKYQIIMSETIRFT